MIGGAPIAGASLSLLFAAACLDSDGAGTASDAGSHDGGPPRADAGPPAPPPSEPGRHDVGVVDTRLVIPSDGFPPETEALNSNNNLDVIRHDSRVYLAWRTAPDHFAGTETVIHVVSSSDEITWSHEASYARGTDLREPRFLSLGGSLFLYVSILGTERLSFDPMGIAAAERSEDAAWTDLEVIEPEPYIAWRTRTERGAPYMMRYLGGEHIYRFDGIPLEIELLTTNDGRAWTPVSPARPVVSMGGGSESDFALGDDGTLYAVVRNEAGDETGWGSKICRAPASDIADWDCRTDPKKYDSPLMFWHDGEAYLVARRNVTDTGHYDLMFERGDHVYKTVQNQLAYVSAPKRCALWRWVQEEHRIAYVLDLPSRGDTCFPAMIAGERPDEVILYNYSSDIQGPDVPWRDGQAGATLIYRHVLSFTPR